MRRADKGLLVAARTFFNYIITQDVRVAHVFTAAGAGRVCGIPKRQALTILHIMTGAGLLLQKTLHLYEWIGVGGAITKLSLNVFNPNFTYTYKRDRMLPFANYVSCIVVHYMAMCDVPKLHAPNLIRSLEKLGALTSQEGRIVYDVINVLSAFGIIYKSDHKMVRLCIGIAESTTILEDMTPPFELIEETDLNFP